MNPKAFIWLAGVTAIVLIAAAFSIQSQYGGAPRLQVETPVFPGLENKVNTISEIDIAHAEGKFTLKRIQGRWTAADRSGYPANLEKIQKTIFNVSQLRLREAKTKMPDRYVRLDLQDITVKKARSKMLTMKNDSGESLVHMIVGNRKFGLGGGADNEGVYFRKAGNKQAWLARGQLDISEDATEWLDRTLIDVDTQRVRRVTNTGPDGSVLTVAKATAKGADFKIHNPPKDAKFVTSLESKLADVGGALNDIDLKDVARDTDVTFLAAKTHKSVIETFDGLTVNVTLFKDGEKHWARFHATANPPAEIDKDVKQLKSAADVRKQADAFNARTKGWTYRLYEYKYAPLTTQIPDLLEKKDKKKSS